jgi:hypothetical protein
MSFSARLNRQVAVLFAAFVGTKFQENRKQFSGLGSHQNTKAKAAV